MGHSIRAGYDTYHLELEVVYAMHLSTIDVSLTKTLRTKVHVHSADNASYWAEKASNRRSSSTCFSYGLAAASSAPSCACSSHVVHLYSTGLYLYLKVGQNPHRKPISLLKRRFSPVCHVPALRDYRINFQHKLRHHDVDHRNTVIVFCSLTIATESGSPHHLRDGCFRYCGGNPYQDLLLGAKPDHICLSELVFPRGIRVHIRRESPCPMVAVARYIPPTEKLGVWKQKVEWVSKSFLFIKWKQ